MYVAYEALPAKMKSRIEGRKALHDATYNSAGVMRKGYQEVTDPRKAPGAQHALVRTHPETGRPCLFLGRRRNRKRQRSEEHTSELQSQSNLVCRLLLEKKKKQKQHQQSIIYSKTEDSTD